MRKTTLAMLVPFLMGAAPVTDSNEPEIRPAPAALEEAQRGVEPVTVEGIFRWQDQVQRSSIDGTGFSLGTIEDHDYYLTFNIGNAFLGMMERQFPGVELIGNLNTSLGNSYNLETVCQVEPYMVLRVPHQQDRTTLTIGDSDLLQENNKLYVIGYTHNTPFLMEGTVHGLNHEFPPYLDEDTSFSFLGGTMDGFGGGPILTEDQEGYVYVVGVFAFYDSRENINAGIMINSVLEDLAENGCEVPVHQHEGEVEYLNNN